MKQLQDRCVLLRHKKKKTLQIMQKSFFVNGKLKIGSIDEFIFDVFNYLKEPMDCDVSIGKLYKTSDLKKLHFYLAYKQRGDECDQLSSSKA